MSTVPVFIKRILKNNLFVDDIRIDLFFSSSSIFSKGNGTSEDIKTFFCSSLDFGRKIRIVFICVGSATTHCLT